VKFSPDGKRIATGSQDKTCRIWDVATGKEQTVLAGHTKAVVSVAFHPDGKTLATGSLDSTTRLWDVATGKCTAIPGGGYGWVISVAFSPDGRILAGGVESDTVRLWDPSSRKCLSTLSVWEPMWPGGTDGPFVLALSFSSDGRFLATAGEYRQINVWVLSDGKSE
jgi:WD40 repeat protein